MSAPDPGMASVHQTADRVGVSHEAVDAGPGLWLAAIAAVLYLLYSANFLYFFVDDEAIPFVYAQNLLGGHGLSYNVLDGPVEGYSDFLHVWLSALVLAAVRALHVDKHWVFFIGKALSLIAGTMVIGLTWAVLRHLRVRWVASAAALGFLALAGPLAVWSCSSLETVPFTLALVALVWSLVTGRHRTMLVFAALMCLDRIDGFVYAGALLAAFTLTAERDQRTLLLRRVCFPLAVLLGVYHGWRVWYFHDWLPTPLWAKVLYKLTGGSQLVVRAPETPYWIRFLRIYGWPSGVLLSIAIVQSIRSGRPARAIAVACAALFVYVAIVGDWMFGFRFFVALMPLIAIVVGCALSAMAAARPGAAQVAALGVVVWSGLTVQPFIATYRYSDRRESFLHARSFDLQRFFFPYFSLYEAAREKIPPGGIIAYNQAGFLPFMLDLQNIDDLGICTRFYAKMPTTDVFFTEVGRYEPLTDKPVFNAGQAYFLYRDVRFVLVRMDLLRNANHGTVPTTLMEGFYELVALDRDGQNAIYRRTSLPAGMYASDPGSFLENVAHLSRLRGATLNGMTIQPSRYDKVLPFLREGDGEVPFTDRATLALHFSTRDESVRELSIDGIKVDVPARVELTLWSQENQAVFRQIVELPANKTRRLKTNLPVGVKANRFVLEVSAEDNRSGSVWLSDLRVQGQRRELERYIARELRFPRPDATVKSGG